MKSIVQKALLYDGSSRETYMLNSQIVEVKESAGRGQEVKFVDFQLMVKCDHQNCTFSRWYQSKTVSSTMTSIHKGWWDDYFNCQLFNKGLYFMMCGALSREMNHDDVKKEETDTSKEVVTKALTRRSWTRLYPMYTHPATMYLAKGITTEQTKHVRRHCMPQFKSYYKSKSARIGSVVEMEMSEELSRPHGVARTGHSDNQNAYDNYAQVPTSIVATGGRKLAGWPSPKVQEVIPTLHSLAEVDRVRLTNFSISKLFGNITVAEFKLQQDHSPDNVGRLLPFLLDIAATLLGALHQFEMYTWFHEYKVRAISSGLFDDLWKTRFSPSEEDKLERVHDYLVEQSKMVHCAWIQERNARDASHSCFSQAGGTHNGASIARMLSDILSNQQHLMNKLVQLETTQNSIIDMIQGPRASRIDATETTTQQISPDKKIAQDKIVHGLSTTEETKVTNLSFFDKLSYSNLKKRQSPVLPQQPTKRMKSPPGFSAFVLYLYNKNLLRNWPEQSIQMSLTKVNPDVVGYKLNERKKLLQVAYGFEMVLTKEEKAWLKQAFADKISLIDLRQQLECIDTRLLALSLFVSGQAWKKGLTTSYSALGQRLPPNWDLKITPPKVSEGEADADAEEEDKLVLFLMQRYPLANWKVLRSLV
jgi:hypothetical protein